MMQPGDMIEWTYEQNGQLVDEHEMLWSSTTKRWMPIGSSLVHTLVSINGVQITWLNEEGCFHARVDDAQSDLLVSDWRRVLPRARG